MVPATPGETVPWAQAGSSGNRFPRFTPPPLHFPPWELFPHPWHLPPAWHVTHQEGGVGTPAPLLAPSLVTTFALVDKRKVLGASGRQEAAP